MAEGVLFPIAGGIIKLLGPLAAEEMNLLCCVEGEVGKLKRTVLTIQGVLLHAEELQETDTAVKAWLIGLSDVFYKAEDLLDALSTEAQRRKIMTQLGKVCMFFTKSNQLAFRFKVAHKIKVIRGELDAVAADRQFHLDVHPKETKLMSRKRGDTYPDVRKDVVIGRKADEEEIIRLMDADVEGNVSILPIVGIGGMGKTTLAKLIFNDHKIDEKRFDHKLWVCVSNNFELQVIVKKILVAAGKKPESDNMTQLIGELKQILNGKKYLLVLDDAWNEDHEEWSNLIDLLMDGAKGSIIIVTTRSLKVAKAARIIKHIDEVVKTTIKPYALRGLGEEESWDLFKMIAFPSGQESKHPNMVNIGMKILRKCSGVPLAIKVVGNLLYNKYSESEWLAFKDKELSEIHEINDSNIIKTLKLSYYELPLHLKHCFAYCSLFPKGYFLDKSNLIELWMAQGFVESEDVGNECFMDLLRRSFFQEAKEDYSGNVIGCQMHDLMHDLATNVAGLEIVIFGPKKRNISEKTRHIAIYDNMDFSSNELSSLHKSTIVRTFYSLSDFYSSTIVCGLILSRYKCLRVLNLTGRAKECIPNSIIELIHLRYLDLSYNGFKKLPNSITKLKNLQTINLDFCRSLVNLPTDIKKLVNLRHLSNNCCDNLSCMPRGLGELTNLRTLSQFNVDSSSSGRLDELKRLNNLKGSLKIVKLSLRKGDALEYGKANLKEKSGIYDLLLSWKMHEDNHSDVVDDGSLLKGLEPHPNLKCLFISGYQGSALPSWLQSLKSLVSLELSWCGKWQYLPPLSRLPSLRKLELHDMKAMEHMENCCIGNESSSSLSAAMEFFPSLETLNISNCPKLKGWWRANSSAEHHLLPSFPRLSELSIWDCDMLTLMPMFPHVEKLTLITTNSKPLQQTMEMNTLAAAATSSSFFPLPKLKFATVRSVAGIGTLPKEWLKYLRSLPEALAAGVALDYLMRIFSSRNSYLNSSLTETGRALE